MLTPLLCLGLLLSLSMQSFCAGTVILVLLLGLMWLLVIQMLDPPLISRSTAFTPSRALNEVFTKSCDLL
jgi:predicted lysophospholipase L1 biosynthesis ABC-type transport system permease subunit